MTYAPGAAPAYGSDYPVQVTVTGEREIDRRWGIPLIGNAVRWVLAIPHYVVLWLLGIGIAAWAIFGWIPILVNGRVPGIAVRLITETINRGQRVQAYVALLMPGPYPPPVTAAPP